MEKTAKLCRIKFLANGEVLGEEVFTIEMAERAGLTADKPGQRGISPWKAYPEAMLFSRALTAGMRTHCPDALGGHTAYTPDELGAAADVVPVTVTEQAPAPTPAPEADATLLAQAYSACADAGLSDDGLIALVSELSDDQAETLDQLPVAILQRLAKSGVSAATVARCNADPQDADDLPAAWSA
jgi:hypothetical protein